MENASSARGIPQHFLWSLAQIGAEGGVPLDRARLCERVVQRAAAALEAPLVGLWLVAGDDDLELEASAGLPLDSRQQRWQGPGLLQWVIRQQAAVRVPVLEDERRLSAQEHLWWREQQGLGALLAAPLQTSSEILGVLAVFYFTAAELNEEHVRILQALAAQGAMALQNVYLFEDQVRRNLELSTLAEIGRALASTREAGRLIQRVLSVATDLIGAERGLLFLLDRERQRLQLAAARGLQAEDTARFGGIALGEGLAGWVAAEGMPLILEDATTHPHYRDWGWGTVSTLLAVPLKTRERILGVLELHNKMSGEPFSPEDLDLLMALASQASIALDSAELYEHLEHRVEESHRELVEAHGALQQRAHEIDAIMRSMPDGLIVTDPEGRIRLVNPAASEMLGLPAEAVGGQLDALVPHPQVGRQLRRALQLKEDIRLDLTLEPPGEGPRALQLQVTPLGTDDDRVWGLVWVVSDITSLRELDRIKTELLSFVSHELRTPLSAVKGFAATLRQRRNRLSPEVQDEMLETIEAEIDRLTRLTLDLLDISRIESGRALELEWRALDLPSLLERVFQTQSDFASTHRFVMQVAPEAQSIWADEDKLEQILLNLINNAAKYSPQGGNVEVTANRQGRQWLIAVRDEGIGIAPEAVPFVFERYRRVGGDPRIRGVGIGLYLVKHLVEAHGGRVWVESSVGDGSTFRFTIPLPDHLNREHEQSGRPPDPNQPRRGR